MNPIKRQSSLVNNNTPPIRRKKSRKGIPDFPKLDLWTIDFGNPEKKQLTTKNDGIYILTYLAEGNYHKVFTVEGRPKILIKIPHQGNGNPMKIESCRVITQKAIEKLSNRKDLRVYKIYKDILEEGYYEIENVPLTFTCGDKASLGNIREIVNNMIIDPKTFLFDFLPKNVHRDEDGTVVVIDPSDREFDLENTHEFDESVECLAEYYTTWSANDSDCIQWFIEAVDDTNLSETSAKLFESVLKKLELKS
ncbi:MAG: hypothetical protein K940chlam3_00919 [Chlamydiae bacterium]|nr:hypothetical protein [Chlamydiota bacterium]